MIDENGIISRDIYYKPTGSLDYLHYDSFHPKHTLEHTVLVSKENNCFCIRLSELKDMLQCVYPQKIIDKGIHNARFQGPAPSKTTKK